MNGKRICGTYTQCNITQPWKIKQCLLHSWMDLGIIKLSKVRQKKTDIWDHLFMKSKKKTPTNELLCKTEMDPQIQETNYGYQRGKGGEE